MSKGSKTLGSFLRTAVNSKTTTDATVTSSSSVSKLSSSFSNKTFHSISKSAAKRLRERSKSPPSSPSAEKLFPPSKASGLAHSSLGLKLEAWGSDHEDSTAQLSQDLTSLLHGCWQFNYEVHCKTGATLLLRYMLKNMNDALMVFKQMERANVKPDSQTYSYLICNCDNDEQIMKYYEEMKFSQIQVSKLVAMALINAYANCGQFEKAKEVLSEKGIPPKHLNEVRNVLVSSLASNGQMSDALEVCEDIRRTGCNLEPKTVICLIDQYQNGGDLNRMLELLDEITQHEFWVDGCYRIVTFCIHKKFLDSAVNLLGQLKDRYRNDEVVMGILFDEVFSLIAELDPPDVKLGLELLQVVKGKFGITPSRKSLDFLLNACVEAKHWEASLQIWKEYQEAGLTYNVLSYLRMYQALLASGQGKSANKMLSNIPRDDPHVCILIQACHRTYSTKKKSRYKHK